MTFCANRFSDSHAGIHGDFRVIYLCGYAPGWYWHESVSETGLILHNAMLNGPFETSQAAFGNRKAAIDREILESARSGGPGW